MTDSDFERLPPHDIETEMCALGSAMLSADAAVTVVEGLTPEDFFRPAHRFIFTAVVSLLDRGEQVNALSVRLELEHLRDGKEYLPDGVYLHSLLERVPTVASAGYYVKALRSLTRLRDLAVVGPAITQLGYTSSSEDAEYAVEKAQKLFDEATRTSTIGGAHSVAELIGPFLDALESGGDQRGVTTGWSDVDRILSKLRPGQLITIGARPGIGKTALLACLAYHVGIRLRLPVFVGTLEMSTDEFMARLVAIDSKVGLDRLLEPKLLTDNDWQRLAGALGRLADAGTLLIDDEPGMGIAHVRSRLRSMRRSGHPAALAVVDYLQLMESPGKSENRQVDVSQFSRSLKLLAKEFEVPIVVGSQLNRDVERRADKKPGLADLRESGSIEQDSDVVILLYRDDVYDPESPRSGEIDLLIEKNRSGPRGAVTCAFQGHYSRVVDMAREDWAPSWGTQ